MSFAPVLQSLEVVAAWLETHSPWHLQLLVLCLLALLWVRVRQRRLETIGECKKCGEGYYLSALKPHARDGAQMAVRCPSCKAWYAVATTNRDVFKVDESYVFARWPSLKT